MFICIEISFCFGNFDLLNVSFGGGDIRDWTVSFFSVGYEESDFDFIQDSVYI